MAARFENFVLSGLVARGEDAFRLCSLAMAEGQRIRGYRGDYFRLYVGDAIVNVRTMPDPETGEELLLGMDTHAVSDCVWELPGWELCPQEIEGERRTETEAPVRSGDPMQRWVRRTDRGGEERVPISVVNADVLTWMGGGPLRLNMAAFPRWVEYFPGEADCAAKGRKPSPEDQDPDQVLLRGVVKDARVGETYLGMEPLTKFLSVTVSTPFGDVELCHPFDMVAEEQKDNVRPGAFVSTLCTLSGDAAIGEYAGGVAFSEEKDLELLRYFFLHGGVQRLRAALCGDCAVTFLDNRQEGAEDTLALLGALGEQMWEAGLRFCVPGTVTAVERTGEEPLFWQPGKACLLIGGAPEGGYAFLCLVDTDSLGRVREITITNDGRLEFEPGLPGGGEDR